MRTRVLVHEAWPVLAAALALGGCGGKGGPIVTLTQLDPGTDCADGGVRIDTGNDANGDGVLTGDEITSSQVVCNGETGTNGTNGTDGTPGTITRTTTLPAGDEHCPYGGVEIDAGQDDGSGGGTANDGVLQDGEVQATSYVCNGEPAAHGTSIEPPSSPAGAYTIRAAGGAGTTGEGGAGGSVYAVMNQGTIGGGVRVFRTGQATTSYTYPAGVGFDLGPTPAVIGSEVDVPVDPSSPAPDEYYQSSGNGALFRWDGDLSEGVVVTGMEIQAGGKLILHDLGDGAELDLADDLDLAGTLTATGASDVPLDLVVQPSNFVGEATGLVDLAGGTADAGEGVAGGNFTVARRQFYYGAVFNEATIDTSGGDGTVAGDGGTVDIGASLGVYNAGRIDASGGDGTDGAGGHGGTVSLTAGYGVLLNTGAIDVSGGNAQAGGFATTFDAGTAGEVDLAHWGQFSAGDIANTGTITATGGAATNCSIQCSGGDGGSLSVLVVGGGFVNTGDIAARGGDATGATSGAPSTNGGKGGKVTVGYTYGSSGFLTDTEPRGDVAISGNVDLRGGAGQQGGDGGQLTVAYSALNAPLDQQVSLYGYLSIDASGGDGTDGGDGGTFGMIVSSSLTADGTLYGPGGSVVNYVDVDLSGGDASDGTGGRGGSWTMHTEHEYGQDAPWEIALDAGNANLRGGEGTSAGGPGGTAYAYGFQGASNSGAFDLSGGSASSADGEAGDGGDDSLLSDWGPVTNTGSVTSGGGDALGGTGGSAGTVQIVGSVATNTGDLSADGGDGASADPGAGGDGGGLYLLSMFGVSTQSGALSAAAGTGFTPGDAGTITVDGQHP